MNLLYPRVVSELRLIDVMAQAMTEHLKELGFQASYCGIISPSIKLTDSNWPSDTTLYFMERDIVATIAGYAKTINTPEDILLNEMHAVIHKQVDCYIEYSDPEFLDKLLAFIRR